MSTLSKIRAIAQITAFLLYANCLQAAVYNNLPIFSFGVSNSTMNLKIEEEILVPSLTRYNVNDSDLSSILPWEGSEQALGIGKEILSWPSMTLGHSMPYIYIAINHALDRIYFNSFVKRRPGDDSTRERYGFAEDTDSDGLKNIRDFLAIREIKNAKLNIEVYSTLRALRNAQQDLQFVSEDAFWDPSTHRIGLYLDPALFHWLPSQVNWGNQTVGESVLAVRNYVSKLLIQIIGHELVHFIQFVTGVKVYNNPFLAEASATFIEENIAYREDLYQLAKATSDLGLSLKLPADGTPCRGLFEFIPPTSGLAMTKLENSIKTNGSTQLDLEGMITMDERTFYRRDPSALQKLYNTSLAFGLFVRTLPREKFQSYFSTLLKTGHIQASGTTLAGLNKEFNKWAKELTREWWSSSDTSSFIEKVREVSTSCLDDRSYTSAYIGANILIALRQSDPESWMYLADVFWNLEIPFFAFDYYARALAAGDKYGYHTISKLTIESRIGDGYEALGNLPEALKWYDRFAGNEYQALSQVDIVVVLRSELKKSFYEQLINRGEKQSQGAFFLLNSYVDVLQLRGCPTPEEKGNQTRIQEAIRIEDWETFARTYKANFEEVRNRMLRDIANTNNYIEVLQRNQAGCN